MKKIEVYKDDMIYAEYDWDTKIFRYNHVLFAKKGDFLFATKGEEVKQFEDTPYLFRRYIPTKGSANFWMMINDIGADQDNEFDIISKTGDSIMAPYSFRGIIS